LTSVRCDHYFGGDRSRGKHRWSIHTYTAYTAYTYTLRILSIHIS